MWENVLFFWLAGFFFFLTHLKNSPSNTINVDFFIRWNPPSQSNLEEIPFLVLLHGDGVLFAFGVRGVCLFVVSVYMLIGVCVVCVLLVVSMVSVMRVCLTTTPVAGSFPTWCPAPPRAKVADGALPASKTGPGLPPVLAQLPLELHLCLLTLCSQNHFGDYKIAKKWIVNKSLW